MITATCFWETWFFAADYCSMCTPHPGYQQLPTTCPGTTSAKWQPLWRQWEHLTSGATKELSLSFGDDRMKYYWSGRKHRSAHPFMSVVSRLQDTKCRICNTVHAFDNAKPTIGCSDLILLAFKTSEESRVWHIACIRYANEPKTDFLGTTGLDPLWPASSSAVSRNSWKSFQYLWVSEQIRYSEVKPGH